MNQDYYERLKELFEKKRQNKPESKTEETIKERNAFTDQELGYASNTFYAGGTNAALLDSDINFTLKNLNDATALNGENYLSRLKRGEILSTLNTGLSATLKNMDKVKNALHIPDVKDHYLFNSLEQVVGIAEAYNKIEHGVRDSVKRKLLKAVKAYQENVVQKNMEEDTYQRISSILEADNPDHVTNFKNMYSEVVDKKLSSTLVLLGFAILLISATSMTGNIIGTQTSTFNIGLFLGVTLFVTGLVGIIAIKN